MATLRKRGSSWQAQIRITGHAPISKNFARKPDAVAWVRKTELQIASGCRIATPALTVKDLLDRYELAVSVTKRGYSQEKYLIRSICKQPIGAIRIGNVASPDVAAYRDCRLRQVKPATVLRELALLRHCWNTAKAEWYPDLPKNPVAAIRLPRAADARSVRLEKPEALRLAQALDESTSPYLRSVIRLAIYTGMRRGELLALTWEHVDLERGTAHLPKTKNGHSPTVALSPAAIAVCAAEVGRTGRLFPVTANALRLAWDRLRARAKLSLRFHDLRHEAISSMFELGLSIPEVAMQSGHKDYRMLARYTHLRATDVAEKLRKLSTLRDKKLSLPDDDSVA